MTRLNAIAMVAGTIIGASIFVQPSEIARHLETPLQIMIVWAACGVLTPLLFSSGNGERFGYARVASWVRLQ